jgi:hypothetical protein
VKNIILLIISTFCVILNAQNHNELDSITGVEIYLFKKLCLNDNSYNNMDWKKREEFISKYKNLEDIPAVFCPEYINSNLCELDDKPFLSNHDIKSFNWNSRTLILTQYGKTKVNRLKYNYHGIPFTIKVKG